MFDGLKALRRVHELEERFEDLVRKHKQLELEWLDTLDRVKRLMGRISRRQDYKEQHDEQEAAATNGGEDTALDPVSRKIVQRRRGLFSIPKVGE